MFLMKVNKRLLEQNMKLYRKQLTYLESSRDAEYGSIQLFPI